MKKFEETRRGTMKASELQAARADLGLTQTEFAYLIGVGGKASPFKTVGQWECGQREIPGTVKILVDALLRYAGFRHDALKRVRDYFEAKSNEQQTVNALRAVAAKAPAPRVARNVPRAVGRKDGNNLRRRGSGRK